VYLQGVSAEEDANAARIAVLERELRALRATLAVRDATPFGHGLDEREALLSEAERIVHLGCWMWDTSTGAIRWSDELFRIFGLAPQSIPLTAETFFERIHPDDVARIQEASVRSLETGTPEAMDFRVVRADGATRNVHMEAAFLPSQGGGARLVGTVLDVTERVELERRLQQSQKMEALGTLAGGVAHDFNNYLQVVFGHLDLLVARGAVGDTRESLVQIREAAERCRRLTRQLLVFSRGGDGVEPEVLALDTFLDRATPMFAALLGDRIRLRRLRAEEEVRVCCDRGGLEQLVLNLLLNARDAMPKGGRVTVEVGTRDIPSGHPTLSNARHAVLSVQDEGGGIALEHVPRLFEPFFSTKGVGGGTGLGLAIAHGIVARHGGAIEIDNVPGRSATFRVLLPLASAAPRATEPPRPPPPIRSRGLVLVVEDQHRVRALVRTLLTDDGFSVLEAADGLDAIALLRTRTDVDLVLSDIAMPRMTGVELVEAMAAELPEIPMILMGGVVDSNVAGLSVPVLHKPFGREELLTQVHAVLADRLRHC